MTDRAPHLKLVYARPKAWIADATIEDTRAFVARCRRAWLAPAVPVPVWFTTPDRMAPDRMARAAESDERA